MRTGTREAVGFSCADRREHGDAWIVEAKAYGIELLPHLPPTVDALRQVDDKQMVEDAQQPGPEIAILHLVSRMS